MPGTVPGTGNINDTVLLSASEGLPAPRERERRIALTKTAGFICSERSISTEEEANGTHTSGTRAKLRIHSEMGPNETSKLLHSKGNHKQDEKTTLRMGENICKRSK